MNFNKIKICKCNINIYKLYIIKIQIKDALFT